MATALILPFNAGQAFKNYQIFYLFYLLIISFIFYGWFWTHGGQTLGLRAWRLQVLTFDCQPITWLQAFKRFSIAIVSWGALGLGFLWAIMNEKKHCWHDTLSKTAIFYNSPK